jgi:hypothetical protein
MSGMSEIMRRIYFCPEKPFEPAGIKLNPDLVKEKKLYQVT